MASTRPVPTSPMASFARSMPPSSKVFPHAITAMSSMVSLERSSTPRPVLSYSSSSRDTRRCQLCGWPQPRVAGWGLRPAKPLARRHRCHTGREIVAVHGIVEPGHDLLRCDVPRSSQSSPFWAGDHRCHSQGAQERLVPTTKGSIPVRPDGGHSSQVGTLLDAAPGALPAAPAALAEEAARDAFGRDVVDCDAPDRVLVFPAPVAAPVVTVRGDPATVGVVPGAVDDAAD